MSNYIIAVQCGTYAVDKSVFWHTSKCV